jgi:Helix-turn-helix domain
VKAKSADTSPVDETVLPQFVDETVVAQILNLKPHTLRQWRWSGRETLPYYKFGSAVKYNLREVVEFARSRRVALTEEVG